MYVDGYLWMWDTVQERGLQMDLATKSFGDVLVAGYGLGIVQEFLLKNNKVKSINTVEKSGDVIEKMKELGQIHGNVTISDFYDLSEDKKYDCIIGDIWPDISSKFLGEYVKFKEKSEKLLKPGGTILAWGSDYFEYLLK
ncbi:MAG: hypothetical protein AAB463_02590 [Patescibacteria group bacterium]